MSVLDQLDAIEGDFVTTKQAAELLNIPVRTVCNWCYKGTLETRRMGKRYWIPKRAIVRMLRVSPPPFTLSKPYLTLKEAASVLHMSHRTLQNWCRLGKIPCRRIGNRYELSRRTVNMMMDDLQERYQVSDEEY
jgi:excisionase family DNA binding protein